MIEKGDVHSHYLSAVEALPIEVFAQIVSELEPRSILALSKTSKAVYASVKSHGWRAMVNSRFPAYRGNREDFEWDKAAQSLLKTSEAWSKKALNAQTILPHVNVKVNSATSQHYRANLDYNVTKASTGDEGVATNAHPVPFRRRAGQTMGYHAILDATEYWIGAKWTDRRELLAVGAGAELLLRSREFNPSPDFSNLSLRESKISSNDHGHRIQWHSWKEQAYSDGKDDITALKLVNREESASSGDPVGLIVGRASGTLEHVEISNLNSKSDAKVEGRRIYDTSDQSVRFMDLSPRTLGGRQLFATGIGSQEIALYDIDSEQPVSSASTQASEEESRFVRTWTSKFLDPLKLAVGRGVSRNPIAVHAIRPEGFHAEPIQQYKTKGRNAAYAIAPLPTENQAAGDGNTFVAGMYDGSLKLYDVRSSLAATTLYDAFDRVHSVYSLLPVNPYLVLAGTSLHTKICAFDLRMSSKPDSCSNLYLATKTKPWFGKSSIYSLVRSSPFSPTIYAGLEGGVMQIDAYAATDEFPDSVFNPGQERRSKDQLARDRLYTPLSMIPSSYDSKNKLPHSRSQHTIGTLLHQKPFSHVKKVEFDGLDDRWL